MIIVIICVLIAILIFLVIQYSFLVPRVKGFPVLMYHKIDDSIPADYLNVHTDQFEKQLIYLNRRKYKTLSLSELLGVIRNGDSPPSNSILITFDDGYKNNFTQMYPILKKYNCKAALFLVNNFINGMPSASDPNEYLTTDDLKKMDPLVIEYGLHTFRHTDYNKLDEQGIDNDLKMSKQHLNQLNIPYQPCFAYTYGSYPKKDVERRNKLFDVLKRNDVELAFRIGNRINKLPFENKLLIKRIDIRGTDSFMAFKIKLKKGRVKLFG